MNYPEIRIKNAWLLRKNVSVHLHELWGEGKHLAEDDEMDEIVRRYRNAWRPYEEKIIHGMCNTLNLEFRQNIIDVYIAPWMRAFSEPLVIGVKYKPDRFVEVLTHELVHRLLTDNTSGHHCVKYREEWTKLFGEEHSPSTITHIPVHAVLQAIFDDVLHEPERTKNDRELCRKWPDYDAAWEYVEKHDYRKIIERLKENYKEIADRQMEQ